MPPHIHIRKIHLLVPDGYRQRSGNKNFRFPLLKRGQQKSGSKPLEVLIILVFWPPYHLPV